MFSSLTLSLLPFLLCFLLLLSSSSPLLSLHHSALSSLMFESVSFLFSSHSLSFIFLSRHLSLTPFPFLTFLFFFSSSCITFLTSLHLPSPSFPILLLFPLSFFLSIPPLFFPLCFYLCTTLPVLFFLDSSSSLPPVPLRLMVPSCFY